MCEPVYLPCLHVGSFCSLQKRLRAPAANTTLCVESPQNTDKKYREKYETLWGGVWGPAGRDTSVTVMGTDTMWVPLPTVGQVPLTWPLARPCSRWKINVEAREWSSLAPAGKRWGDEGIFAIFWILASSRGRRLLIPVLCASRSVGVSAGSKEMDLEHTYPQNPCVWMLAIKLWRYLVHECVTPSLSLLLLWVPSSPALFCFGKWGDLTGS